MTWFTDTMWTTVATAAVVCISPAVAWLTFWTNHREKLAEQRRHRLDDLDSLRAELDVIRHWASTEYDDQSHDPAWYNASFGVREFPREYVERFNRRVMTGEFPGDLTAAVVRLEAAARRFHDMLVEQTVYRRGAPQDIGLRWPAVVAASVDQRTQLTGEALANIAGLTDEDRRWLTELYRRNKDIHVVGIGKAGDPDGLHDAWRSATTTLATTQTRLQAGRDPRWVLVGHTLAGIFVFIGLLLLFDFGWSFVNARRHPPAADSTRSAPADTSKTIPGKVPAPDSGQALLPADGSRTSRRAMAGSAGPTARTTGNGVIAWLASPLFNNLILAATAIIILWYTRETWRLRLDADRRDARDAQPRVAFDVYYDLALPLAGGATPKTGVFTLRCWVRNESANACLARIHIRLAVGQNVGRLAGSGAYDGSRNWEIGPLFSLDGHFNLCELIAGAVADPTLPIWPQGRMTLAVQMDVYESATRKRIWPPAVKEYAVVYNAVNGTFTIWPEISAEVLPRVVVPDRLS